MRKMNINMQQLLGCVMLGGLLLTTPAIYAAAPENTSVRKFR